MSEDAAALPSISIRASTSTPLGDSANSTAPVTTSSTAPGSGPKPRSCITCRSRKVRCDKQVPCANCRRASIACVYPNSNDRPPRWARRLERLTNGAATSSSPASDTVMERIRFLEGLVTDLRGQLEQARKAASSYSGGSSLTSPGSSPQHLDLSQHRETSPLTESSGVQKQFGRLVLQDSGRSRYVSSSFWSRVDDELKTHTDTLIQNQSESSEEETSPEATPDLERSPAERHAFLFRHNLSPEVSDMAQFHPLPSQLPFLVDVFAENINLFLRIVHIPTVMHLVRDIRSSGMTNLSPSNEALVLSICYAAVVSMEDDDVTTNFGVSKSELGNKYRLGLEHALAKADFLNSPDVILVQAMGIFVCLARRHDSPRFIWMMAGMLVKMAQYLGLQRDGANFSNLTPFEVHMRRRIWWVVMWLDQKAAEDQGTDLTIAPGSFDTGLPLNINENDIDPSTKEMPPERPGVTDMTFAIAQTRITYVHRDIITYVNGNGSDRSVDLERRNRLVNESWERVDQGYLQHTTTTASDDIQHWVIVIVARLIKAKLTLIAFTPVLFSSMNEEYSDELRTRLFISAIEVAEYNHALNSEEKCKQYRWVFQTHTHWYATVFLLLDIIRRPWAASVERAWVALHSKWLIPARTFNDKNLRIWVPLRKLMGKARTHRAAELNRLREDAQSAMNLDIEDHNRPLPLSDPVVPHPAETEQFRERWRQLVGLTGSHQEGDMQMLFNDRVDLINPSSSSSYTAWSAPLSSPLANTQNPSADQFPIPQHHDTRQQVDAQRSMTADQNSFIQNMPALDNASLGSQHPNSANWLNSNVIGPDGTPWLWADADFSLGGLSNPDMDLTNMDVDNNTNWYDWVESAKGI
ncbi:hypothetical protein K491DRAFT_585431 [Lophiostoma macrostomum CBS 122681]|uniref:Zn(2)-C6 fungal-type domain-containing protein n=1 Tax=Lophiostoma macrostomum CBS 122681 TaxID=1314788 RepID=A0A6A6TU46_9PLEO|nr:hypothetical protein K491DRAFT_585431 [Lophiostoma macrostomum CBS 122681]